MSKLPAVALVGRQLDGIHSHGSLRCNPTVSNSTVPRARVATHHYDRQAEGGGEKGEIEEKNGDGR